LDSPLEGIARAESISRGAICQQFRDRQRPARRRRAHVWKPLASELASLDHSDVPRLSPPGFGAPLSHDFAGTVGDDGNWWIGKLSTFEGPVDPL
jgi:hypothetical protein